MQKKQDFNLLHPAHTRFGPSREISSDLFSGRTVVKSKGTRYLYQGVKEPKEWWDWRLKRAVYTNWIAAVITGRDAMLWRKPPSRSLPEPMSKWTTDVDLRGTDVDTFFRGRSIRSEVAGTNYVLVHRPYVPVDARSGESLLSKADEDELKIRTFFEPIRSEDLLDWQINERGAPRWAVIRRDYQLPREPGFESRTVVAREVWTTEMVTFYEQAENSSDWVVKRRSSHDLGEVPIVPFYGVEEEGWWGGGWPVCEDILDHALCLYNEGSDAAVGRYLTCNPLLVTVSGPKTAPMEIQATHGSTLHMTSLAQHNTDAKWLEVRGDGAKVSAEHAATVVRTIYEIALRQARRDTRQAQAADSQREDQKLWRASLATVSQSREWSERQCWRLAALWEGTTLDVDAEDLVQYNRDFDDDAIRADMLASFRDLLDAGVVSRETIHELLKRGEILPAESIWTDEQKKIEKDREAQAMPGFGNPPGTQPPFSNGEEQADDEEEDDDAS